jgi:hypothetical protein
MKNYNLDYIIIFLTTALTFENFQNQMITSSRVLKDLKNKSSFKINCPNIITI